MAQNTEEVMTIDDLSVYLKVSKSTLYKLLQSGRVPGQKVGKHWRFRRERIDQWLDSSEGNSSSIEAVIDETQMKDHLK